MKTTIVLINDTAPTLLAKGPGRFRFSRVSVGGYVIGDANVTYATGWRGVSGEADGEFSLLPGEKCFAIAQSGSGEVAVLEYGTP